MREAFNKIEWIQDEQGITVGLNLGFDFCGEHERGANRLLEHLGINVPMLKHMVGYEGRKINNRSAVLTGEFNFISDGKKQRWHYMMSTSPYVEDQESTVESGKKDVKNFVKWSDKSIFSKWSDQQFFFATNDSANFEILEFALKNEQLAIGIGQQVNPFGSGGLVLMNFGLLSEKDRISMRQADVNRLFK